MLKGVSVLVVGSPIQGWRLSVATLVFLNSLPNNMLKSVKVAAFDTRLKSRFSGDAVKNLQSTDWHRWGAGSRANRLCSYRQKRPLADGQLAKAVAWAQTIH